MDQTDLEWVLQHDEKSPDNSLDGTVKLSSEEVIKAINCVCIEVLLDDENNDNAPSSSSSCGGKNCASEDIAIAVVRVLEDLSLTGKDLAQAAADLVTASEDELSDAPFRHYLSSISSSLLKDSHIFWKTFSTPREI